MHQLRRYNHQEGKIGKLKVQSTLWAWRDLSLSLGYCVIKKTHIFRLCYSGSTKKLPCGQDCYETTSESLMQNYLALHFPKHSWNPQ